MPEAHHWASGMQRAGSALLLFTALPVSAVAQSSQGAADHSISISVVSAAGVPLSYSAVAVMEAGVERFANQRGEFFLSGLSPGLYHVRIKQLGFIAKDTVLQISAAPKNVAIQVRLTPIPFLLDDVVVTAVGKCPEATDFAEPQNAMLALIFGEVSKNADRLRLLQDRYPFTFTLGREFATHYALLGPRDVVRDTVIYSSGTNWKYEPGEIVQHDSITAAGQQVMRLPQLVDLADTVFQSTHCFFYRGQESREGSSRHRVDFIPLSEFDFPDVQGSVFLDTRSYVLTSAVFRLTGGDKLKPPVSDLEVTTGYTEIYPNIVIFSEITATQPLLGVRGRNTYAELRQKQRLLNYRFVRGKPGDTITLVEADSVARGNSGRDSIIATFGAVTGTVLNPARQPVVGALVAPEDARLNVTTDVAGQFTIRGLFAGEEELVVSADGYESMKIQVDVVAGKTITLPLVLFPKPPQ